MPHLVSFDSFLIHVHVPIAVRRRRARFPSGALPTGVAGDQDLGCEEGLEPPTGSGAVRQLPARVRLKFVEVRPRV